MLCLSGFELYPRWVPLFDMLYAYEWNGVICYNKENKNEHESHGQERICIKQLVDVTAFAFF